jgi:hypothetical protein
MAAETAAVISGPPIAAESAKEGEDIADESRDRADGRLPGEVVNRPVHLR